MIGLPQGTGPVAIGGVGGSGTRLVAEILMRLGFYMGSDLNHANDNHWFTLLFKRPAWFAKHANQKDVEIFKGMAIFERAMKGRFAPRLKEIAFMLKAAIPMSVTGHDFLHHGRGMWPFKRVKRMLKSEGTEMSRYLGWGWKEPNTHIYIEYLSQQFSTLRYIHVLRHGLDMAFSSNQAQLYNWRRMFEIPEPGPSLPLSKASLQYWIRANKRALELGKSLLGDRFYPVNFDALTLVPEQEIRALIDFLGMNVEQKTFDHLKTLAKAPDSKDRYKKFDLSCFSEAEIEAVREFGFAVDL